MKIELPIFGITDLTQEEGFEYCFVVRKWKYQFQERLIDLDVHFKEICETKVEKVKFTLHKLSEIHKIGIEAVHGDFEKGKVVKGYIEEWKEDIFLQIFNESEFRKFIEKTDMSKGLKARLLSLIRLVRIGIYAESENSFVTMDFAFGYEQETGFRDNMIVITLNPNLEITDISTEG